MANSEVQAILMVTLGQYGLLLLHHSLHTSLLQCPPYCLITDRCMGDVPQGFSDLDSIVCLFSADRVDDMVNIGGGKLGRAATNGLGDGRAVFLMDFWRWWQHTCPQIWRPLWQTAQHEVGRG